MQIIKLDGYSASCLSGKLELGTFDSYGIEQLKIVQGTGWEDLNVILTFNAPNKVPTQVILDSVTGIVDVPAEATAGKYGVGTIVFTGLADKVQRISTDLEYTVKKHSNAEGTEPATPSSSVVQQILTAAENAEKIAQGVRDDADAGKFDGEPGKDAVVDATLTKSGEAADAQVTGEAISNLKQAFIDSQERLNVLTCSFTGNPAVCENTVAEPLHGLIVMGRSQQDGTPSVTVPIAINSVGDDGQVKVTFSDGDANSKMIAFATVGGLLGIPVDSGGNVSYNGQEYIADYIDVERGKIVHRIGKKNISDEIIDKMNSLTFRATTGGYELGADGNKFFPYDNQAMSTQLVVSDNATLYENSDGFMISQQWVSLPKSYYDKGAYTAFFIDNHIDLFYVLETPYETDLTQDEITAYKEVTAYSPTAYVTATDDAVVQVKVQQDINPVIQGIINAISRMGGDVTGKQEDKTWLLTN